MNYRKLGRSDLRVSTLCLGSMTYGTQNTFAEAAEQIDYALDHGINFIDTAEMYPVNPISPDHAGDSERAIGAWLAKSGRREDIVIATKVSGSGTSAVAGGAPPISATRVREAAEYSLQKLGTDYIDLYQLHWPNRGSYHFRQYWSYDPTKQSRQETRDNITDTLGELGRLVDEGKIRAIGLSNESAWGVAQFLDIAEKENLPRVATVQNEYSLLCRIYDLDMAELSHNEDVDLLSFSPLACGLLSGKYQGNITPPDTRRCHHDNLGGRITDRIWPAIDAYTAIADKHGLDSCQMALAWCLTRPFMGSAIFGATKMHQLKNAVAAANIELNEECMADIAKAWRDHPMPI
ncbi:MAG: aldo/keto reductase [Pikeienuella sp.]